MPGSGRTHSAEGRVFLILAACLALFAALRLLAAAGDFYVDEIWSFFFARQLTSPLDAFRLNHDNNHILNTLYLYLLGGKPFVFDGKPTFMPHRLVSVITGTASVWLLWKIASRRGRVEAFAALFLGGLSFPLVLYSSEARGYGLEMMFALASFLLARRYMDGKGAWTAVLFWAAAILAFLSHSSFVFIYLGLLIWTSVEQMRSHPVKTALGRTVFVHLVPASFLALYYLFFLKTMVYGGGEVEGVFKVVSETASMALGLPSGGIAGHLSLAAFIVLAVSGMCLLRGSSEPVFFLSALFIVPALTTSTIKPEFLYFRYFLVCFPFFYLLAAYALSALYRKPLWGRLVFFAMLGAYGVLNVNSTAGLIREGRGAYYEAVGYMVSESPGDVVAGGDHDFRNKLVLDFYSRYFPAKRIIYLDRQSRLEYAPDWLLLHSVDKSRRPPQYQFDSGRRFTLERSYGFSGVSGWSWHVYGRDPE